MSREEVISNKTKYYTVHDGTFRVQVSSAHPDAIERKWETKDGKSGTKYERHIKALFGTIVGVNISEGEYGKNLNVYLDENEDGETPVMSFKVSDRYGEDLLKKLPNLKSEEYRFMPFDFQDKENAERRVKGISITAKDSEDKFTVKIGNFFFDSEKKINVNGYPDPTDDDKSDWEFYFKKANKFLVKYAEENIIPKFSNVANVAAKSTEYPTDEIDPSQIPF